MPQNTPTLHVIVDSREPSVTCAAEWMLPFSKNYPRRVYPARGSDLAGPFADMLKKLKDTDHAAICVLYTQTAELEKMKAILAQQAGAAPQITWFASQYEESNKPNCTQRGHIQNWCKNAGVKYLVNDFETPRTWGVADKPADKEHERARIWTQYRLMRAILRGVDLGEETGRLLQILTEKSLSSRAEELERAKRFFLAGEPDMAGGNYGSKVPGAKQNRMDDLRKRLVAVAATDLNVLIIGETGTGKENLAWYLHEFSRRGREGRPFLSLNCACYDGDRVESELFGHVKGAYTGATQNKEGLLELADGGVIFLDEMHHLSTRVQAKLLRFLQEKEFIAVGGSKKLRADVRVVGAIQPLKGFQALAEDFLQRVAQATLVTRPLRDMDAGDLVNIARNLVEGLTWTRIEAVEDGGEPRQMTPREVRALWDELKSRKALLGSYDWPGNVRELKNMISRRLLLGWSLEEQIGEERKRRAELGAQGPGLGLSEELWTFLAPPRSLSEFAGRGLKLKNLEREYLRYISGCIPDLPVDSDGNIRPSPLAAALGCHSDTIANKLRES